MQLTITLPDDLATEFNQALPIHEQRDFFIEKVTDFVQSKQTQNKSKSNQMVKPDEQSQKTLYDYFAEGDPRVADIELDISPRSTAQRPEVEF